MFSERFSCLTTYGDIAQFALPIYAGIQSVALGRPVEGGGLAISAAVQQFFLDGVFKKYIPAPRPFPNNQRLDSFPSGHTAGAFLSVGLILALDFTGKQKSSLAHKITMIALAILVGVSRSLANMHWPVDIVFGAALGLAFGAAPVFFPSYFPLKSSNGLL